MKSTPACPLICGREMKPMKSSAEVKKCYKPGPVVRNSFFNFLRDVRKSHCGLTVTQIAKKGAELWRKMSDEQKCKYMQQAFCADPYKRKERKRRRMRRQSRKSMRK